MVVSEVELLPGWLEVSQVGELEVRVLPVVATEEEPVLSGEVVEDVVGVVELVVEASGVVAGGVEELLA